LGYDKQWHPTSLKTLLHLAFSCWFFLNYTTVHVRDPDKTHFIQFTTKYSPQINLNISYTNKLIAKAYNTKFLGIY